MTTSVSIASQSLSLLRANTINSFSDETNEAEICDQLYEQHVQYLLSIYPWTFASKKRQLSQDSEDPLNEYTYSHIIPSEALLLWALFSSDAVGASPVQDYDIYGTDTARRVFSNYPSLYADYVFYPNEAQWPAYFTQFVIMSFASLIAIPVTGNSKLATLYEEKANGGSSANFKGGLFGIAAGTDAKQKRNEMIVSSPITSARFG